MSAYTYDHNTAHLLEPVQGYDIVSFMNFWAPIHPSVEDAMPGTVMHRDANGKLLPGLTATSMAQFLYSKQDTEDVVNNPVTANGLSITSISMNSYGDYDTPPFNQDGWQSGVCSNIGSVTFDASGNASAVSFAPQKSVYTTFPGACGLELGSSEFARFKDDGTTAVTYAYDQPLTSPEGVANYTASGKAGTVAQNKFGGFLKPGEFYKDNICGVVSRLPKQNENGTWIITFWACHKPALAKSTITAINS